MKLERIRKAYDLTVEQYNKGITPFDTLPEDFKNSPDFIAFKLEHPHVNIMFQLEEYLGRPNVPKLRVAFEQILTQLFTIERTDDSQVMLKYFVKSCKIEKD